MRVSMKIGPVRADFVRPVSMRTGPLRADSPEAGFLKAVSLPVGLAQGDSARAGSARADPARVALEQTDSAETHPVPHTMTRAVPSGLQIKRFGIATSGTLHSIKCCARQKPPSSVRTSPQRVKRTGG